jgi:hypothetical protein
LAAVAREKTAAERAAIAKYLSMPQRL